MEEIFKLTPSDQSSIEDMTKLKYVFLETLPKLKNIWSMDPNGVLHFHDLEELHIHQCGSLEHVLPLSVVICCSKLNRLCIGDCKEIVAVTENEDFIFIPQQFELNALSSLTFKALPKLKGFYGGNHTLACPSLSVMTVLGCAKLTVFKTQEPLMLLQEPLFVVEEKLFLQLFCSYGYRQISTQLFGSTVISLINYISLESLPNHNNFPVNVALTFYCWGM